MTSPPRSDVDEKGRRRLSALVAGLAATVLALCSLGWLAGQLSAVLTGHSWPATSPRQLTSIARAWAHSPADPRGAWSAAQAVAGPAWLIYLIFMALLGLTGYVGFRLVRAALNWRRRREFRLFRLGFASGNEIRQVLSADAVLRKGRSVRPSVRGRRRLNPREVGFYIGRDTRSRQELFASVEDVFVVLAPPRQGKDVHFCAPFTIDAPGACIVTSTRTDAFTNTYALRAKLGRVWVFDPNGMTNWPERLRWSPIVGAENPRVASTRASAIVAGAGMTATGNSAYWIMAATTVIRIYLHAAAVGGRTMRDVIRWSTQPTNPEPVNLLREAEARDTAAKGWAAALEATAHSNFEHVGAVWSTVVQALTCFSDPDVLEACSPSPSDALDIEEFLAGRNTLYILGKEQKNGSVAPIVTAMLEDMFDKTRKVAARMPSSRLDPPLTVELNEAAHIAPMPNLPSYMGDSGGFSIALHVYLQSLSQARSRWGDHEAMIMWDNAAVRVIMGGAGNVDDLEDISRLMGEVRSPSRKSSGRAEGRRVLSAEEVRTLKFGTAVVVARAARPVEVQLTAWWNRPDGKRIAAGKAATERLVGEYSAEADRNDRYRRPVDPPADDANAMPSGSLPTLIGRGFRPLHRPLRRPQSAPATPAPHPPAQVKHELDAERHKRR